MGELGAFHINFYIFCQKNKQWKWVQLSKVYVSKSVCWEANLCPTRSDQSPCGSPGCRCEPSPAPHESAAEQVVSAGASVPSPVSPVGADFYGQSLQVSETEPKKTFTISKNNFSDHPKEANPHFTISFPHIGVALIIASQKSVFVLFCFCTSCSFKPSGTCTCSTLLLSNLWFQNNALTFTRVISYTSNRPAQSQQLTSQLFHSPLC